MELCEYDLDHLVKVQPFKEDDITLFLHQLCESLLNVQTYLLFLYLVLSAVLV